MITFNELLERTKTKNIAVHTPTEDEAKALLAKLHKRSYAWNSGTKLTIETFYKNYEEKTAYAFERRHKIAYCSLDWYQENDYTIVEFSDIDFQEE